MANEQMEFPETWEEYEKDYGFNDSKEVYTNNSRLIQSFRVKQWLDHLPSIQPTTKENLVVGDCISREFIEIVVEYPPADLCTYPEYRGKPYFSIKYRENGKEYVGFGTYKIEILSQWIKQYFVSNTQSKTGHWIDDEFGSKCSCCGIHTHLDKFDRPMKFKRCPNCGVKMLPTDSNCDSCKNQNEVDGSNCYECVKGIRNNYKAESEEKE